MTDARGFDLFLCIVPPHSTTPQAAAIHDVAKKGDVAAITAALDAAVDVNQSSIVINLLC